MVYLALIPLSSSVDASLLGDRSRLEIEGAAAHEMASTQRIRADEATADAERAHQRAMAAIHEAREARDGKFSKLDRP